MCREFLHLTYLRVRLDDHLLDNNLFGFQRQLEISLPCKPPATGLSQLDSLSLEILWDIVPRLDLQTLSHFRLVNRRAYHLLGSHPQYKAIITHARNALYGILSIQAGRWITCKTLYDTLCTSEREHCGDFGGYIYLLGCRRVCFLYLSRERQYLPLLPTHACRKFGLDRRLINDRPHMNVIPNIYSPNEMKVSRPSTLVDYESALHAGIELHGSLGAMNNYTSDMEAIELRKYQARASGSRRLVRQSWVADPYDGQSGNPLRFVSIARVPWLDKTSQKVDWGFHCLGCEEESQVPLHFRRKFTETTFKNHLSECGDIKDEKDRRV